jgi:ABC-2 type transport system permease protein
MQKIFIILKREYLTRVKRKSFLLSTFLFPIVMILFIVGSVYFTVRSKDVVRIAIPNDSFLRNSLHSDSSSAILVFDESVDRQNFEEKGYDGLLSRIGDSASSKRYTLYSKRQMDGDINDNLRDQMNRAYEEKLMQIRGVPLKFIDSVKQISHDAYSVSNSTLDKQGNEKTANAGLARAIGLASGLLIYITMFIFGAMVMRGVMEEKMNRIAEVIISSVRPFQLMMGKIIGIAAVGLTQFLLWIILIFILVNTLQFILPADILHSYQQSQQGMPGGVNSNVAANINTGFSGVLSGVPWTLIIFCFFFYFIGGYLFYAALFAAVGSVVNEDPQEAQSLMLPITMPIILSFIILSSTISHPNSPVAFWASMIPFSSPIVMMGRIAVPGAVPAWQLILSMILLVLGFLFTTWFAGKIYRTGILLYGKRVTWKEMFKWLRR